MAKIVPISEANAKLSGFDLFWEVYPRRQKKGDAVRAWKQTENIRPSIEEIIAAIQEQEKSVQWQKDGGQYIPLAGSWLRSWQWLDEN